MNILDKIHTKALTKKLPDFRPGDTIKVHTRIKEGDKDRIQIFEGVVLKRRGCGISESITVRKVSYGVGVERIFPLYSPAVAKIEVDQRGKTRRSRLYYLRKLTGKKARLEAEEEFFLGEKEPPSKEKSPGV